MDCLDLSNINQSVTYDGTTLQIGVNRYTIINIDCIKGTNFTDEITSDPNIPLKILDSIGSSRFIGSLKPTD
jgi:hypothetical protein